MGFFSSLVATRRGKLKDVSAKKEQKLQSDISQSQASARPEFPYNISSMETEYLKMLRKHV